MKTEKQESTKLDAKAGCLVPCLLVFGIFILTGFIRVERPFGGTLLALAIIAGAVALLCKQDWQDVVFKPLCIDTGLKRYVVLGITISFMLLTFVTTSEEEADALWEEGKKSEAVERYADRINRSTTPEHKILKRVIEYHFESGDMDQVKHFCTVAVKADVEPSLEPNELRVLYQTTKADFLSKQQAEKEPEQIAEQSLPEYEVIQKKNRPVSGWHAEILVPSFSRATPVDTQRQAAKAIADKEGCKTVNIYSTREAHQAMNSPDFKAEHPNAAKGYLGTWGNIPNKYLEAAEWD
ncbi:MAG: hypothetical protein K0U86_08680 [Planctomycetes bacterium]|nr:hypothetical protein [Planctomycetota bacterium]MCH9724965.1 hypothetical protein [Planctomycetota bacterium]MCH9777574.1 hypothetical protein [Planctomycetota bacterium]MCH9793460.1 hypothetical protein [Planctomycetota bacterium]